MCVFVENTDVTLELDVKIDEAGLTTRSRLHVHRCKEVEVTVNYNQDQKKGFFSPSATVDWVKEWAVAKDQYDMSPVDAAEHVLKLCNAGDLPDGEVHIGTLVKFPDGTLCFDLVPKQRVEGIGLDLSTNGGGRAGVPSPPRSWTVPKWLRPRAMAPALHKVAPHRDRSSGGGEGGRPTRVCTAIRVHKLPPVPTDGPPMGC